MEPEVAALILFLLFVVFVVGLPKLIRSLRRDVAKVAPALPRPTKPPANYDWDRRTHQAYRKIKGIGGPAEQRGQIEDFLDTHEGVDAYVEPRTVMHPLSVVLIDAARYGYPKRMRRDQGKPNLESGTGEPTPG
jgi:hypothetical protein